MFGEKTHSDVRKAFLNAGIDITTRTIAKFRRNEPTATVRVMEALKKKNKGLGDIQFPKEEKNK